MRIPSQRLSLEQEWREIPSFPGYSVSRSGLVRNEETRRTLARVINNRGITFVGLMRDNTQHQRAIAPLVAEAFLPPPPNEAFDTPINLDGDRSNNKATNLMWRPRWFAVKYHQQFTRAWSNKIPVEDVDTGETFDGVLSAAVRYGLLAGEILMAASNYTYNGAYDANVWPTGQRFRITHILTREKRGLV